MESVSEVEAAADKMAAEAGLDDDLRFHITMAVHEATVNAVLHGNEYDPSRLINVVLENTGKGLHLYHCRPGNGIRSRSHPRSAGA